MSRRFQGSVFILAAILFVYFVITMRSSGSTNAHNKLQLKLNLPFGSNTSAETVLSMSKEDARKLQTQTGNFVEEMSKKYGGIVPSDVMSVDTTLTVQEERRLAVCVKNGPRDRAKNGSAFWGKSEFIRHTHHTYLKETSAVIIEVGGNRGDDASEFVRLYNPRYIILEPLEEYAGILKKKFENNTRVTVINLGLGKTNEVVLVTIEGANACATSKFATTSGGGKVMVPLYLTNAVEFLTKVGVGTFGVDLITFNCEGCEYEALETLLASSLINRFKNIQFATHSYLPELKDSIPRYCRIQELLSRTHRPTYQYRFIWESWRRRDL